MTDRRAQQRRGGLDRRSHIPRRMADRKRRAPGPYAPEQAEQLRRMIAANATLVSCPTCQAELVLEPPVEIRGSKVWEVYCADCHRQAMVAGSSAARILVIDDDELVRDTLGIVLTRAGHSVLEVADAETGLDAYREEPFDVVVADIFMPGMNGLELIRLLRRDFPNVKIVAMSGHRPPGTPDPLVTAKRLGAREILRKPFTPPQLVRVVDELLPARAAR